jgi:hypothetical protein
MRKVVLKCVENFRRTGSVLNARQRKRSVRTPDNINTIRESIELDPERSVRRLAQSSSVSHTSTHRILRYDLFLFPYKIQVTHELLLQDRKKRVNFAKWFLEMCSDKNFLSRLVMSDEAHFYLKGIVNKQNCRFWAKENPRRIVERPLHSSHLTVWCGVTMRGIIGPFFFENENGDTVTVNGERYMNMLHDYVFPKLVEIKLTRGVWFQQDGATSHTSKANIGLLKSKFHGRLISKFGDVWWPPRSPDLTPPDFFLWGYLKEKVYRNKPKNLDQLKCNITEEISAIPIDTLKKVMNTLPQKMESCIKANGSHLSDVIFKK